MQINPALMILFEEMRRQQISSATRQGLEAARARGAKIGRPRLVADDIIKRICDARDAGESFGAIARALTREQIPTPLGRDVWQDSTVRRIYRAANSEAST